MRRVLGIVIVCLLMGGTFGSLVVSAKEDKVGNVWATAYHCVYDTEIAGTQTVTRTISGTTYTLNASFLFGGYGVAMQGTGRTGPDGDYIRYIVGTGGPGEVGDLVYITDEVRQRYAEELGITDFTGFGELALPNPSKAQYEVTPGVIGARRRILSAWYSIAVHVESGKRAVPLDAKGILYFREGTTPEEVRCMSFSVDDTGGGEVPEGVDAEYWIDIYVGEGESALQTWRNTGGNRLVDLYITPIGKGLAWLRCHQNPDGSWGGSVGVTSLAALAFLNAGCDKTDPTVEKAIGYILGKDQSDGRITTGYDTYETSLAILTLVATHSNNYNAIIEKAAKWLKDSQWDENCLWGSIDKDD